MFDLNRDVPLAGRTISTFAGDWTIHVEGVAEPTLGNAWWRLNLRLAGPEERRVTLVVTHQTLFVVHRGDAASWILDKLRSWLVRVERGEELWLT